MKEDIDDIKNRMLSTNILVHNVTEQNDEDIEKNVKVALIKPGYSDIDSVEFIKMCRIGTKRTDGKPRSIIAVPKDQSIIRKLLAVKLSNAQKKLHSWISPMSTDKVRETRQQLGTIAAKQKAKTPNINIKMRHTTLKINGQRVTKYHLYNHQIEHP